ncbi:MAG: DUF2779 domain-containing protein, partial [Nitrospirae bacterium]|nr:DUF2779 domain-containing protein [Nitrospirota bacterium]
ETEREIKKGTRAIFEGSFSFNDVFTRVDIIDCRKGYHLYEVKSTTEVKAEHKDDVALHYYVLAGVGVKVSSASVAYINNQYVRNGDIEPAELFSIDDVTDVVMEKQEFIAAEIEKMKRVLLGMTPPSIDIGEYCDKPYTCDFKGHCWKNIPKPSVFDIRGRGVKKYNLYRRGIVALKDIPINELSPTQRVQVECTLEEKDIVKRDNLKSFLKTLWYPICFLDFETFMGPIPLHNGIKPYQQVPFQYSIDVLENKDSALKHYDYLAYAGIDCRQELIERLILEISENACVIVYNRTFETMVLNNCIGWFPQYKDKIENIISNIKDLMLPFKNKDVYFHKFNGSYSIKCVLPVLVPELSYEGLDINNGGMAMFSFFKMAETDSETVEIIRRSLIEYCRMDTIAMVRLFEKLEYLAVYRVKQHRKIIISAAA